MKKIANSLPELIGNTPLLNLRAFCQQERISAEIYAKLESFNPSGSAKARVALQMLDDARESGLLQDGAVIIEPTSGNTGIGLACVALSRGYQTILTMPDTMSKERISLLKAYGAQIVLTEGSRGMAGAVEKAEELAKQIPGSFIPSQFTNPSNPKAHYRTTGPEIWRDTEGEVDILVATVGTGGTLSGTAAYLKEKKPSLLAVAVEPLSSPLLTQGKAGPHKIQGIGANFIPETLDRSICDLVLDVSDEDAYAATRTLCRTEGLLCGISSGAALCGAKVIASRYPGKKIVVILPDSGERYLSVPDLFE